MGARPRPRLQWLALVVRRARLSQLRCWVIAESTTVGDASRGTFETAATTRCAVRRVRLVATEVSQERLGVRCRVHPATLLVTHPLAMAGAAYLLFTIVFPSMLGAADPIARRVRVERIRASGPSSVSTRTGAKHRRAECHEAARARRRPSRRAIITVIGMAAIGIERASLTSVALSATSREALRSTRPGGHAVRLRIGCVIARRARTATRAASTVRGRASSSTRTAAGRADRTRP